MSRLLLLAPKALTENGNSLNSLAALTTYVEDQCEVRVLGPGQSLEDTLKNFRPNVVGVTSYTYTYPEAVRTMKVVEQVCSDSSFQPHQAITKRYLELTFQ